MVPVWKPKYNSIDQHQGFNDGTKLPLAITRLLLGRGFNNFTEAKNFLYPQLKELKDPFSIAGMKIAVDRMVNAFINSEKICIYADFDLDGTSGLALLKSGLESLGFKNLICYQPKRLSEGYGFHASAVEDLARAGAQVIITVDVGITSSAACQRAKELGIDVILTDHHLPSGELPKAYVVVNPNQKSCDSKLGYLCGAGVAFYFLRALKRSFFENESLPKNEFDLKSVLDLFTIATLTDMVPLIEDNRVLVKHGLIELQKTKRPGLRTLIDELGLSKKVLTSQDVGMKIAPKINALSRMETEVLARDLYFANSIEDSKAIVSQVMKNNSDRVQKQTEAEAEAIDLLKDWDKESFIFVVSKNFHRGILGLVATKLVQIYNKPCFVGSLSEEDGVVVGSARTPNGSEISLVNALEAAAKGLNRFGGHSAAAGFEMFIKNQSEVVTSLNNYFTNMKLGNEKKIVEYDTDILASEITAEFLEWHDFLGPFGTGFPVPLFRLTQAKVIEVKDLKGGHLRLELQSKQSERIKNVMLFNPSTENSQMIVNKNSEFDFLLELQWNYFLGKKTIQALVKDVVPRNSKSDEINL